MTETPKVVVVAAVAVVVGGLVKCPLRGELGRCNLIIRNLRR